MHQVHENQEVQKGAIFAPSNQGALLEDKIMNSDEVIKRLKKMATDQSRAPAQQEELEYVINHIQHLNREISELREDITEIEFE